MTDQPENIPSGLSRREFLRHGLSAAAALAAAGTASRLFAQSASSAAPAKSAVAPALNKVEGADLLPKSRVIVITHPEVLVRGYDANRPVLEKLIERAVRELSGAESAEKAWRLVAADGDRVSVKITRAGGPNLRTHDEIPKYIARRLTETNHLAPDRICAWDREDLTPQQLELSDPFTLPSRKQTTRFRAALVKDTTCIINLPVLKMHSGTGASLAMKNHFGSINNPSAFHGWDHGEMWKSIAELSNLEPIKSRTRLVLIDATRPLYDGGPDDHEDFRWNFGGLILGTDPVAVEATALDILETKRAAVHGSPWPVTDGRKVVDWAQKIGLGQADPSRIDLVTITLD
jgi:hypothetical protein